MYPSVSDPDLFRALSQDDEAAFSVLFRRLYEPLASFALQHTRDRATAEEVVQEAFVQLWLRRAELRAGTNPRAYLFRAVRNRSIDIIRHRHTRRQTEAERIHRYQEVTPAADAYLDYQETQQRIARALDHLPERAREVFLLSRVGELTYREIADVLDLSYKTVEAHMSRALRDLRQTLLASGMLLLLLSALS